MKTIQPVNVWYNGGEVQATVLSAYVSGDNLIDTASFSYQLLAEINPLMISGLDQVVAGYLTMTGEIYQNWDNNDYAYDWIAQELKLTITGEYVPPVPPEPVVEETIIEDPVVTEEPIV
jgi:hypothetical protein